MSFTVGRVVCDVCGEKIILIPGKKLRPFKIKGLGKLFHQCDKCRPLIMRAHKEKNWRLLPDGPLKEAYYMALKEQGLPS